MNRQKNELRIGDIVVIRNNNSKISTKFKVIDITQDGKRVVIGSRRMEELRNVEELELIEARNENTTIYDNSVNKKEKRPEKIGRFRI